MPRAPDGSSRSGSRRSRRDAMRRGSQRRQAGRALAPDRRPCRRADRLHHERYYGAGALERTGCRAEELAELFVADIADGIDAYDYSRSDHPPDGASSRVIKVAGSDGGPIGPRRRVVRGRGARPPRTGAPDPHPLRRHRRARAGRAPRPTSAWRSATSRFATSTRSSTATITASCSRLVRSPSTTSRSAGPSAERTSR